MMHPEATIDHPLVWAEIDLDAIAHNVRQLREITLSSARLLVAVKANGYGHGATQVAQTALKHGASDIGVARIDEGIALRKAGISAPILIFGYTSPAHIKQLVQFDLVPTISSFDYGLEMARAARNSGHTLAVQIKIDTGMGRLGLPHDDLCRQDNSSTADKICMLIEQENLRLQGVYTHFATADHADTTYAKHQFDRYTQLLTQLQARGVRVGLRHAANSGAIMQMPETHLDMVRAGISVYGLYPSGEVDRNLIDLKPALSLKARIIHIKDVLTGTSISYGCTYKTEAPTTIATIPIGYADGFQRLLSNKGAMLVGGYRVPIVGRVCMDLTMIDVGRVPQAKIGDEVVLIGVQGDQVITADEIADSLGTINYEIVSALTERVPRIYKSNIILSG